MTYTHTQGANHPSVLTSGDATNLMMSTTRALVRDVVEWRGHAKPPFLPQEYAAALDVRKIETTNLANASGLLLQLAQGYIIRLNEKDSEVRRNFSCCHEMGHILFRNLALDDYVRQIEYRTYNPPVRDRQRARTRERLCDVAATELLMPSGVFKAHLHTLGLGVDSIAPLASAFKVSVQAAAIRVAELASEHCLALLWQPWPKSGQPKGLRVSWARHRPDGVPYRPVRSLVPRPSSLHKAFDGDASVSSLLSFAARGAKRPMRMESKGFGYETGRYVLSMVFPER